LGVLRSGSNSRLAGSKWAAFENPGLLELHQHRGIRWRARVDASFSKVCRPLLRHVSVDTTAGRTSRILIRGKFPLGPALEFFGVVILSLHGLLARRGADSNRIIIPAFALFGQLVFEPRRCHTVLISCVLFSPVPSPCRAILLASVLASWLFQLRRAGVAQGLHLAFIARTIPDVSGPRRHDRAGSR